MVCFILIFVYGARKELRLMFYSCGCFIVPTPFIEKIIIFLLHCFCFFVKDQLTVFVGVYFWALYSALFIYLSTLSPILPCLDYCSFILIMSWGYVLSVLPLIIVLAVLGSFVSLHKTLEVVCQYCKHNLLRF